VRLKFQEILHLFHQKTWSILLVLVCVFSVFSYYVYTEKQLDDAYEARHVSYQLVSQLRQTSDDLTRMVRSYVLTGDTRYKSYFQNILDIRNGNIPLPDAYFNAYWDMVIVGKLPAPSTDGKGVALLDMMLIAGFTKEELDKLTSAKKHSDELTTLEFEAMRLAESAVSDMDTYRLAAAQMLLGSQYHQAKSEIMKPINETFLMMDRRTQDAVNHAKAVASTFRAIFVLVSLWAIFYVWRAYRALRLTLGASADEVHQHISRIGSGDFSMPIKIAPAQNKSVLAELAKMQDLLHSHDVERTIAEQNLRLNKKLLVEAQHIAQVGSWSLDCQTEELVWSDEIFHIFEIEKDQFPANYQAFLSVVHPQDRAEVDRVFKASVASHRPYDITHRLLLADGSIKWVHERGTSDYDVEGNPTYSRGTVQDVTERHHAETLIRKSERYLSNILNSVEEVIWTASAPDFKVSHVNAAIEKLSGISPQTFMNDGDSWVKLIHVDDRAKAQLAISEVFNTSRVEVEYRIVLADGHVRWVSDRRHLVYAEQGVPAELVCVIRDETDKKLAANADRESKERVIQMLETSPIGVRIASATGDKVLFANKRYTELINCAPDTVMGRNPKLYYANPLEYEAILAQVNSGHSVNDRLIQLMVEDKGLIWVIASYRPVHYEGEAAMLGWFYDVTELRQAQEALLQSEALAKQSLEELKYQKYALDKHAIVAVTDVKGRITYANDKFSEISGYTIEELIGQDHAILNSGYHPKGFFKEMYRVVASGQVWHDEVCNRAKDGTLYWVDTTIAPFLGDDGKPQSYISIRTDITQRKAAEDKSNYLALYDTLTNLPNRRLLLDRLNQALAAAARSVRNGALLFLDLDHFKTLNDTLGHDVGDLLLQQVAERLTACVREGDTVARLGGDEFVVILEGLSEHDVEAATQAEVIGEKILAKFVQPYQFKGYEYHITSSIGITLFGKNNLKSDELLKQADIAMYQAKKLGRNALSFFDPKMQEGIQARVDMEHELRKALDKNEFQLFYQMQVDVSDRPVGAEALIRWIHPERGLIPPGEFIPIAEDTGMILAIGDWVIDAACAQLKCWEQNALTQALTLSVNVSAKQFHQADFVAQIKMAVTRHAVNPMLLKLELTESALLDHVEDTIEIMSALKDIGVRFSLDDFGTGYSSLQYLRLLPLYQLKIDRSFVQDIAGKSSDQAIVRTIIAMAHTLNLNVIAEGVETQVQQGILLDSGCVHYQGYLFSKPLPIDEFESLL
jgi:diguanylate cyclase (GGDEF)-like protein/PAS domain S-box-containing protein